MVESLRLIPHRLHGRHCSGIASALIGSTGRIGDMNREEQSHLAKPGLVMDGQSSSSSSCSVASMSPSQRTDTYIQRPYPQSSRLHDVHGVDEALAMAQQVVDDTQIYINKADNATKLATTKLAAINTPAMFPSTTSSSRPTSAGIGVSQDDLTSLSIVRMLEPTPIGSSSSLNVIRKNLSFSPGLLAQRDEILSILSPEASAGELHDIPILAATTFSDELNANNLLSYNFAAPSSQQDSAAQRPKTSRRYRHYQSEVWYERFYELNQYQKEHGNCMVPHNWKPNQKLAQWVKRQRYQYKLMKQGRHSTLSLERYTLLNNINFVWDAHDLSWDENFAVLCKYHQTYGHTNVPPSYDKNPSLSAWVKNQRRQYKLLHPSTTTSNTTSSSATSSEANTSVKSTLTKERIEKLETLGFVWNPTW